MKIQILAGGPASFVPDLKDYDTEEVIWVGVDRGVFDLFESDIQPVCAFGDFDSVTQEQQQWLKEQQLTVKVFPMAKDKTDLELALEWALGQNPDEILIFGATGGRLDHELANISLLLFGIDSDITIQMIDRQNIVQVQKAGNYELSRDSHYEYVSFLPHFGKIQELTLEGFKYPLHKQEVPPASGLTVSNELIAEKGTYSFSGGIVLLVRSSDGMRTEKTSF